MIEIAIPSLVYMVMVSGLWLATANIGRTASLADTNVRLPGVASELLRTQRGKTNNSDADEFDVNKTPRDRNLETVEPKGNNLVAIVQLRRDIFVTYPIRR